MFSRNPFVPRVSRVPRVPLVMRGASELLFIETIVNFPEYSGGEPSLECPFAHSKVQRNLKALRGTKALRQFVVHQLLDCRELLGGCRKELLLCLHAARKEVVAEAGGKLAGFAYYVVGEGIEKRDDNLADEVAKMLN